MDDYYAHYLQLVLWYSLLSSVPEMSRKLTYGSLSEHVHIWMACSLTTCTLQPSRFSEYTFNQYNIQTVCVFTISVLNSFEHSCFHYILFFLFAADCETHHQKFVRSPCWYSQT